MLCTLIGAIILSINIQVGLDVHLYDDIGDASSFFEGRHLVFMPVFLSSRSAVKKGMHTVCF